MEVRGNLSLDDNISLFQPDVFQALSPKAQLDALFRAEGQLGSLHAVIRFRATAAEVSDGTSSLGGVMEDLLTILDRSDGSPHGDEVRLRASRVLGRVGAVGIEPCQLKQLLCRLRTPSPLALPLLEALELMASPPSLQPQSLRHGSGQTTPYRKTEEPDDGPWLGSFFLLDGEGAGLRLPLREWPFAWGYQLAMWLRVEAFPGSRRGSASNRAHILRLADAEGHGVDYYLEDSQLCVAISDAQAKAVTYLDLTLRRRRWYRLVIHHQRALLFGQDELRVYCDGVPVFEKPLPLLYPRGLGVLSEKDCVLAGGLEGAVGAAFLYCQPQEIDVLHAMLDCVAGSGGGGSGGGGGDSRANGGSGGAGPHVPDRRVQPTAPDLPAAPEKPSAAERFKHMLKGGGEPQLLAAYFPGRCREEAEDSCGVGKHDCDISGSSSGDDGSGVALKSCGGSSIVAGSGGKRRRIAVDVHSGLHAVMVGCTHAWTVRSACDAVTSIGGVSALLPMFERLYGSPQDPKNTLLRDANTGRKGSAGGGGSRSRKSSSSSSNDPGADSSCGSNNVYSVRGDAERPSLALLLSVLAAFLERSAVNRHELLRVGGIAVLERIVAVAPAAALQDEGAATAAAIQRLCIACGRSIYFFPPVNHLAGSTAAVPSPLPPQLLPRRPPAAAALYGQAATRLLANFRLWAAAPHELQSALAARLLNAVRHDHEAYRSLLGLADLLEVVQDCFLDAPPALPAAVAAAANRSAAAAAAAMANSSAARISATEAAAAAATAGVAERRHMRGSLLLIARVLLCQSVTAEEVSQLLQFVVSCDDVGAVEDAIALLDALLRQTVPPAGLFRAIAEASRTFSRTNPGNLSGGASSSGAVVGPPPPFLLLLLRRCVDTDAAGEAMRASALRAMAAYMARVYVRGSFGAGGGAGGAGLVDGPRGGGGSYAAAASKTLLAKGAGVNPIAAGNGSGYINYSGFAMTYDFAPTVPGNSTFEVAGNGGMQRLLAGLGQLLFETLLRRRHELSAPTYAALLEMTLLADEALAPWMEQLSSSGSKELASATGSKQQPKQGADSPASTLSPTGNMPEAWAFVAKDAANTSAATAATAAWISSAADSSKQQRVRNTLTLALLLRLLPSMPESVRLRAHSDLFSLLSLSEENRRSVLALAAAHGDAFRATWHRCLFLMAAPLFVRHRRESSGGISAAAGIISAAGAPRNQQPQGAPVVSPAAPSSTAVSSAAVSSTKAAAGEADYIMVLRLYAVLLLHVMRKDEEGYRELELACCLRRLTTHGRSVVLALLGELACLLVQEMAAAARIRLATRAGVGDEPGGGWADRRAAPPAAAAAAAAAELPPAGTAAAAAAAAPPLYPLPQPLWDNIAHLMYLGGAAISEVVSTAMLGLLQQSDGTSSGGGGSGGSGSGWRSSPKAASITPNSGGRNGTFSTENGFFGSGHGSLGKRPSGGLGSSWASPRRGSGGDAAAAGAGGGGSGWRPDEAAMVTLVARLLELFDLLAPEIRQARSLASTQLQQIPGQGPLLYPLLRMSFFLLAKLQRQDPDGLEMRDVARRLLRLTLCLLPDEDVPAAPGSSASSSSSGGAGAVQQREQEQERRQMDDWLLACVVHAQTALRALWGHAAALADSHRTSYPNGSPNNDPRSNTSGSGSCSHGGKGSGSLTGNPNGTRSDYSRNRNGKVSGDLNGNNPSSCLNPGGYSNPGGCCSAGGCADSGSGNRQDDDGGATEAPASRLLQACEDLCGVVAAADAGRHELLARCFGPRLTGQLAAALAAANEATAAAAAACGRAGVASGTAEGLQGSLPTTAAAETTADTAVTITTTAVAGAPSPWEAAAARLSWVGASEFFVPPLRRRGSRGGLSALGIGGGSGGSAGADTVEEACLDALQSLDSLEDRSVRSAVERSEMRWAEFVDAERAAAAATGGAGGGSGGSGGAGSRNGGNGNGGANGNDPTAAAINDGAGEVVEALVEHLRQLAFEGRLVGAERRARLNSGAARRLERCRKIFRADWSPWAEGGDRWKISRHKDRFMRQALLVRDFSAVDYAATTRVAAAGSGADSHADAPVKVMPRTNSATAATAGPEMEIQAATGKSRAGRSWTQGSEGWDGGAEGNDADGNDNSEDSPPFTGGTGNRYNGDNGSNELLAGSLGSLPQVASLHLALPGVGNGLRVAAPLSREDAIGIMAEDEDTVLATLPLQPPGATPGQSKLSPLPLAATAAAVETAPPASATPLLLLPPPQPHSTQHAWWRVTMVLPQTLIEGNLVLMQRSLLFQATSDAREMGSASKESELTPGFNDEANGFVGNFDLGNFDAEEDLRSRPAFFRRRGHTQSWRLDRLTHLHLRRFLLQPGVAVEMFWLDRHEVFLWFQGREERRHFTDELLRRPTPLLSRLSRRLLPPRKLLRAGRLTEAWCRREISNFDYLMQLNVIAGRTYNDVNQYPVLPWVIADYHAEALNLSSALSYRDLSKPMGALDPQRLESARRKYSELQEHEPDHPPYLYGSLYSHSGSVLHFLARQEPYTKMHVRLQSGCFDLPNRLFSDVARAWDACSKGPGVEVRELVPEFYCLPEAFLNTNRLPLGQLEDDGGAVDDVRLPPWARGSAYRFVRLLRRALESEYVSQRLHLWIDLVFGARQHDYRADNVFRHQSYEGKVDLGAFDGAGRTAMEHMIMLWGQVPSRLLSEPHPPRLPREECVLPCFRFGASPRKLALYTPPRQAGIGGAHGAVVSVSVAVDRVFAIYADLTVAAYSFGREADGNGLPFTLGLQRRRALPCRVLGTGAGVRVAAGNPSGTGPGSRNVPRAGAEGSSPSQQQQSVVATMPQARLASSRERLSASVKNSSANSSYRAENSTFGRMGRREVGAWNFGAWFSPRGVTGSGSSGGAGGGSGNGAAGSGRGGGGGSSSGTPSHPGRDWLLSCGYWDDTVKVHALDSALQEQCSVVGGHFGPINCLAVGDHAALAITGGADATCRVWVVDSPAVAAALAGGSAAAAAAAVAEATLPRQDAAAPVLACVHVLWGHEAPVTCVALSVDLDLAVSGARDGRIITHLVTSGRFVRQYFFDPATAAAAASIGAGTVAAAGETADSGAGGSSSSAAGSGSSGTGGGGSSSGVSSGGGALYPRAAGPEASQVALSCHGDVVVHSWDDLSLHLFSLNGARTGRADAGARLTAMQTTKDGELLLTGDVAGAVTIRLLEDLSVRHRLDLSPHGGVTCLRLCPEDQHLLVGSDDGLLTLCTDTRTRLDMLDIAFSKAFVG